jgi:hypothetical protein
MNEIIISILKIYITTSIVYFIYLIYLNITKSKTVDDLINEYNEETMINEYKKMKKKRAIVIIFGILLGIAILILTILRFLRLIKLIHLSKKFEYFLRSIS